MSLHCDQCEQGRRCTGACMQRFDAEQREPIGLAGVLFWFAAMALGVALTYLIFGG